MPEAVLFDLDGTLADTAPDLGAAANLLREECGLPPLPLETYRPLTSSGVRGMLRVSFGITPDHADYSALSVRFLDIYSENLCVATRLFDGMNDLIDQLEASSIKWGIVTNKRRQYTAPLIAALNLATRACCVISGDSAARPKPAPDPLLLACELASLAPARCIYVGDDLRDVQAGSAAGMTTIAAGWGYLGEDLPIDLWGADAVIQSPMELLSIPEFLARPTRA